MSTWIRSSACTYGNCVEVRHVDGHVEVRDNTAPDDVLTITPADWAAFLVGAKAGEFDGPAASTDVAANEKAFIDGWLAARATYGATDDQDVDHGAECPRARGDYDCYCDEDTAREWAEQEWAERAERRALLATDTTPGTS